MRIESTLLQPHHRIKPIVLNLQQYLPALKSWLTETQQLAAVDCYSVTIKDTCTTHLVPDRRESIQFYAADHSTVRAVAESLNSLQLTLTRYALSETHSSSSSSADTHHFTRLRWSDYSVLPGRRESSTTLCDASTIPSE